MRKIILALIVGLGLIRADRAMAQSFIVLHSFTARTSDYGTNVDGSYPVGRLVANSSGNVLYGTANLGGQGYGTVFSINIDGSGFTNLHSFVGYTNGTQPLGGVILSGNRLYGTAWQGGASGKGAVFALNTDGTGFSTLRSFTATAGAFSTNSDGAHPIASLVLSGNRLYGTANSGGRSGNGTIFAINTDGAGFTNLHSFTAVVDQPPYPNNDGTRPRAALILFGDTLYGTALGGGSFARGTVFKLNTNGSGFTVLHNFTTPSGPLLSNGDGANPVAGLLLADDTLYGTTENGGNFGQGTAFKLNTDGTGFTTLHSFFHHTDGFYANATLALSGSTLYGAAAGSGMHGGGTLFALKTDGTRFTNLHNFNDEGDGGAPDSVFLLGNSLYGVARTDGDSDNGTLFRLSFTPQLTINRSEANVILTWPADVAGFDYTGFTLQSIINLVSPAGWSTNSSVSTVVNGQNTVTNPASEPQGFFRLKSP